LILYINIPNLIDAVFQKLLSGHQILITDGRTRGRTRSHTRTGVTLKVGRYLTREIAEKNSWRPIVVKLGIWEPQVVLFDLSVTLATLLLYSWRHERHNESRHFQAHTRFTAASFCDNGARKLKTIPGWPRNFPHFISSAQNAKYKITMADNVVFITKWVFSTSFLFCDRRCLTAYFTLTQIDGYFLKKIF